MHQKGSVRIATYNVHKCVGLDRRLRPNRILQVLQEIDADIVALQEIIGGEDSTDQVSFLADALQMRHCMGSNRNHKGKPYGNAILSRYPFPTWKNHDITVDGREPRGCLRADIPINEKLVLHIFNVHLGTDYAERKIQARKLLNADVLNAGDLNGVRVVLGDFNEWMRGVTTRLLNATFRSADILMHLGRSVTYPGILPFLHLDHIYFDAALQLDKLKLHRSRTALVASDHLPLVADFHIHAPAVL